MTPETHYRHSNRISILLFPIALAVCGAIAAIGAVIYAYSIVYVPVAQLAFLLPLIYGAAIGALLAFVLKKAKVRSTFLGAGIAILLGLGSYLLSWSPWAYATYARAGADVTILDAIFPPSLAMMIAGVYETGAWSIGSSGSAPVSGVMLGICWALEALFVLVTVPIGAIGVASSGVFCEACDRWCHASRDVMRLPPHVQEDVARRLDAQDVAVLAETPRAQPYDNPFLRIDLEQCPNASCGKTNALSMALVTRTQQNGREHVHEAPIVQRVLVSRDHADWVKRG